MEKKDIIDAYVKIRKIDQTIPDEVLDLMKNAALAALEHPATLKEDLTVVWTYAEARRQIIVQSIKSITDKANESPTPAPSSNTSVAALRIGNDAIVDIMDDLKIVIDKL